MKSRGQGRLSHQLLRAGYARDEARRDPELLALRADPRYHRMVMKLDQPRATESPRDLENG